MPGATTGMASVASARPIASNAARPSSNWLPVEPMRNMMRAPASSTMGRISPPANEDASSHRRPSILSESTTIIRHMERSPMIASM